jgi:hypothetical protein
VCSCSFLVRYSASSSYSFDLELGLGAGRLRLTFAFSAWRACIHTIHSEERDVRVARLITIKIPGRLTPVRSVWCITLRSGYCEGRKDSFIHTFIALIGMRGACGCSCGHD